MQKGYYIKKNCDVRNKKPKTGDTKSKIWSIESKKFWNSYTIKNKIKTHGDYVKMKWRNENLYEIKNPEENIK